MQREDSVFGTSLLYSGKEEELWQLRNTTASGERRN